MRTPGSPLRWMLALLAVASTTSSARGATPAGSASVADHAASQVASIDLSAAFPSRASWRFVAWRGPSEKDPLGDEIPGRITMCLRRGQQARCDPALDALPDYPRQAGEDAWPPRYLQAAQLVYPGGRSGAPLFLVRTDSEFSGDGDQVVATQVLAYRPRADRFERIYEHVTGHNNNQEVRFMASGPLRGDIIAVEELEKPPYFGFWVTVSALTPAYTYRQVLQYRSATRYGDGNPLAVIDSEMPNIEARLGLWRPGSPLPLPGGACPKPHLVQTELWCK